MRMSMGKGVPELHSTADHLIRLFIRRRSVYNSVIQASSSLPNGGEVAAMYLQKMQKLYCGDEF